MSLNEYLDSRASDPVLEFSPHESARSGLRVGRLTCGVHALWTKFQPAKLILESDFDLVIFRYPSNQVAIAEQLTVPGLKSWIADTLLYFEVNAGAVTKPDPHTSFRPVLGRDAEFDDMLDRVFADYQNHYSANSKLANINVSEAYADWVRNQVDSEAGTCYAYRNEIGELAGLGVLESISDTAEELTLVGVHPDQRGKGSYLQVLRHLAQVTVESGKSELVTSTQASNIASMRAWCKEGFLPSLSINTLHVMPFRK